MNGRMPLLYEAPPQNIAEVDIRLRSAAWMIVQVAGAAGLARDAVVAGIDEADELRALAVEQRVAALRGWRSTASSTRFG